VFQRNRPAKHSQLRSRNFPSSKLFKLDGRGNFSGTSTESVNGAIDRPTFTGTYTVKPDCTGSALLTFNDGGTAPLDFIIEDDGKQVAIIVAGENGSNGENETGTAVRQFNTARLP
jgi:hypothetical protein